MIARSKSQSAPSDTISTVQRLVQVAASGLPQMFDPQGQLFCYSLKRTRRGLVREGASPRYTAITLMGLHRLLQAGTPSPVALEPVLNRLLANTEWVDNIGDLGLLVWLCALMAPERLDELDRRLAIGRALSRYRDAKQGRTMELAWFLSGLSHWVMARPNMQSKLRDQAYRTYGLLIRNQGKGVFAHLATRKSLKGMVRGNIGSFADQVYPIYAMSKFCESYQEGSALRRALDCAQVICKAQGPLGQWWWHYDCLTGQVFEGYPVFSVHQHGMGPMTLLALAKTSQMDFDPWIYKGLEWITRNELTVNMEDAPVNVIWRCIQPSTLQRYSHALFGGSANAELQYAPTSLKVLFECRPYELGWLLYAFAGRASVA